MEPRTLVSLLVLGASIATAELIRGSSPALGAVLLVVLGAVVASVASAASPTSIGLGALAAVAYGALRPHAPIAAWACFAGLVLLGRGVRARGAWAWMLHTALSLFGGACAMWVTLSYVGADTATHVAAIVVATSMLGLPLLVPVDDVQTASLLALARRSKGASRMRLLRAAALSRRVGESEDVSRADRRVLATVLASVHRAALRAERRASRELDETLSEQLGAIARFLRALAHRGDATLGLETRGDARLALAREVLETEARALRELE